MKLHQLIVTVLVFLFTGIIPGFGQQTAEQQYQSGIYKEEIEGDLDAAVKIYEKILKQYPDDRPVAAKTHLHIGICHEKLGNAAARKAYERVVSDFADQTGIAAQARKRLAALAVTARGALAGETKDLTLTKIYAGNAYAASISPDGKKLALIRPELSSRDIWIRDIATGKEVRLTNSILSGDAVVWSPDSRWIAFADQDRELKVVPTGGGPLRTLFTLDPNSRETVGIIPTGWTSDSRKVIFQIPSKGLFAVPASSENSEPVFTFESPEEAKRYEAMTLSPDSRWIAFSAEQNGNTDIFIISPVNRVPVRITTNPAADRKPRWSPDGKWLAFTSSGTENPQIWAIQISPNGEPDGLPVQISRDAHVLEGDWTGDASIGFSAAFRTEHIFTSNFDGAGEIQVTQFASLNTTPRWSPGGDRIAFRSDYRKPLNKFQLWTVPPAGGSPRLVSEKEVSDFLWSADGEKLYFRTKTDSNRSVSMEIPARGGEPKEIMPLPGEADGLGRSPDGQNMAYTFTVEPAEFATADEYMKERLSGIGIAPKGGGEPRILIPADKKGIWYSDCRLDPEGKRIAYIRFDYAQYGKEDMSTIWTMDMNGGTPRQIATGGEYALCWSPDGKWIVFEKRIKDMDFELWKVPANGGEPVKMNIRGRSPEFSPDGKKIAYSRRIESGYEYWMVKNFDAWARFTALGSPGEKSGTGGLVTRRIREDAAGIRGELTADGKYIRHLDRGTGDVIQYEVATGKINRIKNTGPWGNRENYVEGYAFSRDGKQLAYDRFTMEGKPQLRIRNLDGSGLRTLYSDGVAMAYDWSPDAGSILALRDVSGEDYKHELVLISATDGSVSVLKSIAFFPYMLTSAIFSPDGRYIAFSLVNEDNPSHVDVYLMTADSRNEVVIAGHPAEDKLLAWTPDGKSLLFSSDRSGTGDIWTVRIKDGKQQGEPEIVKKDFGRHSDVFGFAPDGSLYYRTTTPLGNLYLGEIDIETGKVVVPPHPVATRYNGAPSRISWSPDGKNLLYISFGRAMGNGNNHLTIRSAETGEERLLPPVLRSIWDVNWAPDNRHILAMGMTVKENALFRIDAETGKVTKLANGRWAPHISQDGKTMVYLAENGTSMSIKIRDLETGQETTGIKVGTEELRAFSDLSPDGRKVAFQDDSAVYIVSIKGGEPQKLFKGPSKYYKVHWTPDGKYLIAQAIDAGSGWYLSPAEVWRIPVQGGTPLKLDLSIPKMEFFALHPDNRRFAFSIFEGTREELWVMENFLPK